MPVVNHTVYDPAGSPVEGVRVSIRLVGSTTTRAAGGFVTANDREVLGESSGETDNAGLVTFTLVGNDAITPDGTYYEVSEHRAGWPVRILNIDVPTAGGPYNLADLLTTPPSAIVPAGAASLAGANQLTNYQDLVEVATPGTPAANTARLFARDDGAGTTELVVKWPSGNETVIASDF